MTNKHNVTPTPSGAYNYVSLDVKGTGKIPLSAELSFLPLLWSLKFYLNIRRHLSTCARNDQIKSHFYQEVWTWEYFNDIVIAVRPLTWLWMANTWWGDDQQMHCIRKVEEQHKEGTTQGAPNAIYARNYATSVLIWEIFGFLHKRQDSEWNMTNHQALCMWLSLVSTQECRERCV